MLLQLLLTAAVTVAAAAAASKYDMPVSEYVCKRIGVRTHLWQSVKYVIPMTVSCCSH
jgi:hypothetical protein